MPTDTIQYAFHSGEWAPALNARVDLVKYKSAAQLLRNFYVDYRGGVSTRPGTEYITQCFHSNTAVRLIPFQASFDFAFMLEFGNAYIRFIQDGAPVLEEPLIITNITNTTPAIITVTNNYALGDWVYITGVQGMTQVNGRYFLVQNIAGLGFHLHNLDGTPANATAWGVYTQGGTVSRVYTLPSPYTGDELALLKFITNVDKMIIDHSNYSSRELKYFAPARWTLEQIVYGATVAEPHIDLIVTNLPAGVFFYSYGVTAVDQFGEESSLGTGGIAGFADMRVAVGTNRIGWTAVVGAVSYNVYKVPQAPAALSVGSQYGYIGTCTGTDFLDTNIEPDFSITPPIIRNPFFSQGVVSYTVGLAGVYTIVPQVILGYVGETETAVAQASLGVVGVPVASAGGAGYVVGEAVFFPYGVILTAQVVVGGAVLAWDPGSYVPGSLTSGVTPSNPLHSIGSSGVGVGASAVVQWGLRAINVISTGTGYDSIPSVTLNPVGGTASAVLGTATGLNPTVPAFHQQRLVQAGPVAAPQAFYMSQPGGTYFNFNIHNPIQPDDSISAAIVANQLNTIKAMVSMPPGLIILSDKAAWLITADGSAGAVTPINVTANAHSYNGISDVPPIVANFNILYVQAKGSIIREIAYSFEKNIFTGTDISVLSSHLFYGYQVLEWAWAEEPFKQVFAIRNDGTILMCTFMREQDLIGWTHYDTDGLFLSVASITEQRDFGATDSTYVVVEREINGIVVKYIERFAERVFTNGAEDAWCVDAGLRYDGAPATTFSGAIHLAGETVTGLADGLVITPFVMPATGTFTLTNPASIVVIGKAFTCQLQTLALELGGQETIQGKDKKISSVDVRVADTLGLKIGSTFNNLVIMKDLQLGQVGGQTNQLVSNLVTGDARTILDPKYQVPGVYCIEQSVPYPATILGVVPNVEVGDTPK